MAAMSVHDVPWWRWRSHIRSALHMLGDPAFQDGVWRADQPDYGTVTDAVYRLVEDAWLDHWSAGKYVGTILRDADEAALVDAAVVVALRTFHAVGPDQPAAAYLDHPDWPAVVEAANAAHRRLAEADGEDPDEPPRPLSVLAILTGATPM